MLFEVLNMTNSFTALYSTLVLLLTVTAENVHPLVSISVNRSDFSPSYTAICMSFSFFYQIAICCHQDDRGAEQGQVRELVPE